VWAVFYSSLTHALVTVAYIQMVGNNGWFVSYQHTY